MRADLYELFLKDETLFRLKDKGVAYDLAPPALADMAEVVRGPAHAARLVVLPPLGKALHVEDRPAVRPAAEARHAPGDVAEEGRPRHLAVVADIDAAVELAAHDMVHRLVGQRRDPRGVDLPALGLSHQQVGQDIRPRQAAHVGGQDAIRASFHRWSSFG